MFRPRVRLRPACQLPSRHAHPPPHCLPCARTQPFHASAPRKDAASLWSTVSHLPPEMLIYMHSCGLPWYAVIPASAVVVRALLVALVGIRTRKKQERFAALKPLQQAMSKVVQTEVFKSGGFSSPTQGVKRFKTLWKREQRELLKRWDCKIWEQFALMGAQIPVFLWMADGVRQVGGLNDGLWQLAKRAVGFGGANTEQTLVGGDESSSAVDVVASKDFPYLDLSLGNEGMLWFPDLLAPDPTGLLPVVVSSVMIANILLTHRGEQAVRGWQRGMRRGMIVMCCLIVPLGQTLPSALLLYWTSSTMSVMLSNWLLNLRYPPIRGFEKCKRPIITFAAPPKRRP